MRLRLFWLFSHVLACGSVPPSAVPPSTVPPQTVQPAPASPPPNVLVLSGQHAFVEARWLPSGALVARTTRELWIIDPKQPERARFSRFDSDLQSLATNEHDDTVAVATVDGVVTLVRDLVVRKVIPGDAEWGRPDVQLSPDGKLLGRTAPRATGDAAQMQVLDVDSGKTLLTFDNTGTLAFDGTSKLVSNHDALFDLTGAQKYALPAADHERIFTSDWVGPRLGYQGSRALRLVDPTTGKTKSVDIACKDDENPPTQLYYAGRFLRACGNRFMMIDGATGALKRIKLPIAPGAYASQISLRGAGYVVSFPNDEEVEVDVDTGKAKKVSRTWRRVDQQPPTMRRGDLWAETALGSVTVRNVDSNALIAGWGAVLDAAVDRPFVPMPGLRLRVRGGALEVTNPTNPMLHVAPFLYRFGPELAASLPPGPPSECGAGWVPGQLPFSAVDSRPVDGRTDAICICLDVGCDVRPLEPNSQVLAASADDLLTAKSHSSDQTHLVRTGKHGTHEVDVDGYCMSAAIAADRRVFASCYPGAAKGKRGIRKGVALRLVELAAADLTVVGTREIAAEYAGQILEAVGDEIAFSGAAANPVAHLFPQGEAGCTTACSTPIATVSTWPTFAVLDRGGQVQVAGKATDAARAIVCIDGDVATPWATCHR